MATEIRDLQDQLYEYDHEYRLLEQELESLRRQIEVHNSQSRIPSKSPSPETVPSAPLQFTPRDELPKPSNVPSSPKGNSDNVLPRSSVPPPPTLPSIIVTEPEEGIQSAPPVQPEKVRPVPQGSPSLPTGGSNSGTDFDFNPEEIAIPSITTSAIQPPRVSPRKLDTAPESDLEVNLSQIELPLQLTVSPNGGRNAKVSQATEVVADQRVVELAFHPILCRSVNFDDDEHEDGVFLVLQPRNRAGQFVPVPASLTVEIIDPSREQETSIIGIWKYNLSEVRGKIQPIGSQQGIHLTLPWNGPNPKADRITVRVSYTFENGRQVVNSKELYISGPGKLKTVWAPRASSTRLSESQSSQRRALTASLGPSDTVVPATGIVSQPYYNSATVASGPFLPPDSPPTPQQ